MKIYFRNGTVVAFTPISNEISKLDEAFRFKDSVFLKSTSIYDYYIDFSEVIAVEL